MSIPGGSGVSKEIVPVPAVKVVILYPATLEESVVDVSPPPGLEILKILGYLRITTPSEPPPDDPCKFPEELRPLPPPPLPVFGEPLVAFNPLRPPLPPMLDPPVPAVPVPPI